MGVIRYDGADWCRFQTLASPLANTSNGAHTCAILLKRAIADSNFRSFSYLLNGSVVTQAGISVNTTGLATADYGAQSVAPTLDFPSLTETYIIIEGKSSGTVVPRFSRYVQSTNTWTHENGGTSLVDGAVATMLEIGSWAGGSDLMNGWIGLIGWWTGNMSDTNRELLDDNWSCSNWYNNPHGTPTALIPGNVEAASMIDLIGNASNIAVTGTPTLDNAETLANFNFDGTGSEPDNPLIQPYILRSTQRWR